MPTIQSTQYKRFGNALTNGNVSNQVNLLGTNVGTASLADQNDYIRLYGARYNTDTGTSPSYFSEDIPSNAVITGVQYQIRVDGSQAGSPLNTFSSRLLIIDPDTGTSFGTAFSPSGFSSVFGINVVQGGPEDNLGLNNLIYDRIDNLYLELKYSDDTPNNTMYAFSNTFASPIGPYPAIKVYYYIPSPKVTVARHSGAPNFFIPKVTIQGGTKVTIKQSP